MVDLTINIPQILQNLTPKEEGTPPHTRKTTRLSEDLDKSKLRRVSFGSRGGDRLIHDVVYDNSPP